jgi:hypothetical protein
VSFAHLSTVGTLSYNGYTFDGSSEVSVRIEFVPDEAKRTILYHRHTIRVKTFVQSSSTTDLSLESIRAALGHQGQALTFINKGFGDDLIVNSTSGNSIRDVKWGPTPKVLAWNPVGAANACELEWEVEVCVPKCSASANGRFVGVMAMNYEVSISVDNRGLSTRTVSGYLEIAQTRVGYNVPDSADAYRGLIAPPQPEAFGRESDWRFSSDRSRVEFSITDTQIPSRNPYPLLVTHINGTHRNTWSRGSQYKTQIRHSINMEIEAAMGAPAMLAYNLFGQFVRQRINVAKSNRAQFWLDEVSVEEDIFGLSSRFSCSYRTLLTPSLALNNGIDPSLFAFEKLGMWYPVGTSWSQWRNSLSHVFDNRGLAGLAVPAANDVIIDLCNVGTTIPWNGTLNPSVQPVRITTGVFKNERPPPEQSYVKYNVTFKSYADTPTVRQAPIQPSEVDGGTGNMFEQSGCIFPPRQAQSSALVPDVIQKSGPSQHGLSMSGYAIRAGYPIPRPKVTSVGGQTPVERSAEYHCEDMGSSFGVPVFGAAWQVDYELPSPPSIVTPPIKLESS